MAPKKRNQNLVRRDEALESLAELEKWFDEKAATATLTHLEVHCRELERGIALFDEHQSKVEQDAVDDDAYENEKATRRQFKAKSLELQSLFLDAIGKMGPKPGTKAGTSTEGATPAVVVNPAPKIKPISLPEFDGDRKKWHLFWEKFRSLVDRQPYEKTDKLIYLQEYCKGDALDKISRLEPCDDNYDQAVRILKDNYEDAELTVADHVAALFNLPVVAKDDVAGLRKLVDAVDVHLRALESLDRPVAQWSDVLIHLLQTKLNRFVVMDWQKETQGEIFPSHRILIELLRRRCQVLERINQTCPKSAPAAKTESGKADGTSKFAKGSKKSTQSALVASDSSNATSSRNKSYPPCHMCKETTHFVMKCPQYQQLSVTQRIEKVQQKGMCTNCLRSGHAAASCQSKSRCLVCNAQHHTTLHADEERDAPASSKAENSATTAVATPSMTVISSNTSGDAKSATYVVLPTAIVHVRARDGTIRLCRCLLDSGSQRHLVTEEFAKQLGLQRTRHTLRIGTVGGASMVSKWLVSLIVQSPHSDYTTELEAHVVPRITSMQPGIVIDKAKLQIPAHIKMADELFDQPHKIDLLIGIELFNELLKSSDCHLGDSNLICTQFGHVILGRCPIYHESLVTTEFLEAEDQVQKAQNFQEHSPRCGSPLLAEVGLAQEHSPERNVTLQANAEISKSLNSAVCMTLELKKDSNSPFKDIQEYRERSHHCGVSLLAEVGTVPEHSPQCSVTMQAEVEKLSSLERLIQRFWAVEDSEIGPKPLSKDEEAAESHFVSNIQHLQDGRLQVRLPFNQSPDALGDSRRAAERALRRLEAAFRKDSTLKEQYREFIDEFIHLGHMRRAEPEELQGAHYFLPHHPVIRPDSSLTKLRVVFNGSAKTTSGRSLNDLLMTGPIVQDDLLSIIIRSRFSKYVISADIIKMYRQIAVHEDDQRFQLILWRNSPDDEMEAFAITRVVYGLRPSPFLATRCLKWLAEENTQSYPLASQSLIRDCYVDNLLTGCDEFAQAEELCRQICALLAKGKFELHKWCSNEDRLLKDIPEDRHERKVLIDGQSTGVKTLGLMWDGLDNFRYSVHTENPQVPTKRIILGEIARIFDPLNLASPAIVLAKQLMQDLWRSKIDWDGELQPQVVDRWRSYRQDLPALLGLAIPRQIRPPDSKVEIHCFTDASSKAYGAAIYVVAVNHDGSPITSSLLCARSRVAPLKTKTIARLELCAALLGAELVARIEGAIPTEIVSVGFWTDSEIVLHWIAKPANQWDIFVGHRVAKLQELTSRRQWHFVPTSKNPADLVSRGVLASNLINSKFWLHGPEFLLSSRENWPAQPDFLSIVAPERKKHYNASILVASKKQQESSDIVAHSRYANSFIRLQRTFAWILHWRNVTQKSPTERIAGKLSVEELAQATNLLVRYVQRIAFPAEINSIQSKSDLPRKSPLRFLNPVLDNNGVLRVMGRLANADLDLLAKQPAILPSNHPLTYAIVRYWHERLLHAGPKALLGHVRNYFWPLRGVIIARRIVRSCIGCFRVKPRLHEQQMGPLPACRVNRSDYPFFETGVDYCGPFSMSPGGRGRATLKVYVAIYVCMATRAVTIDAVTDLSTEGFMASFRRFIARRGLCAHLHSDNMKGFVGAKAELRRLYEQLEDSSKELHDDLAPIKWTFIPPRAPHAGGIWEAAVKSCKFHLKRCLPTSPLKLDEWMTLLLQIEAIMNSRPIAPMPDTTEAIDCLTPGHFIIGAPLVSLPEPEVTAKNIDNLTRWRRIQSARDIFWHKWSTEYLQSLQQRAKWTKATDAVKVNDIVIIKDDQAPPQKWRYGIITQLHTGKDGLTRVVTVRSKGKEFLRDIRYLAPLPIDETSEPSIQ